MLENEDFMNKNLDTIDLECDIAEDDCENFKKPIRTISADIDDFNNINFEKHNFNNNLNNIDQEDYSTKNYNTIDMECSTYDDTEPDFNIKSKSDINLNFGKNNNLSFDINNLNNEILDFSDDEDLTEKELVIEDVIDEKKKKKVTSSDVEDDYWTKLKSKTNKLNKKSNGIYTHFCGNPELEKDLFNQAMGDNSINVSSEVSNVDSSVGISSGFTSCSESLNKNNYTNLFENLLYITGFNVVKNKDNSYTLTDLLSNKEYTCCNKEDVFNNLKPYIDDCFIYPLQIKTNQNFNNCKDWCDWYANNKNDYPECNDDISYCDLIANHIIDCEF